MLQVADLPLENARVYTQQMHSTAIEQVIQTMREHLAEPLSLEDMSDIACLSPFYFNRIFRRTIGLPPGEFLSALRLDAAKRLLLTTDLSITDICFEVGYIGLGSFTTRFTQQVGVPPRLLRHLARNTTLTVSRPLEDAPVTTARSLPALAGSIQAPSPFQGDIFIGLFPKPVPQGRPVRCTMLHTPGFFCIDSVPVGTYFLLVAAFPRSSDPHTYLLPPASLLVGSAGPLSFRDKQAIITAEVRLRPWRPTDPPIIAALPFL
ncbi:MAG: helix-turn-helix transcriptional regulator [Ktedonobacteraceae bacterium]|nr:helix-turn-helix transcriptional regulator [Ktedonobacteraceae bacterium]MBO0795453.1 helix-turn-helix transcriptional regulator [Ktedonobacteraceae bacterium]